MACQISLTESQCLWALSNEHHTKQTADSLRKLNRHIHDNERYSKHGKYFEPFWSALGPGETQTGYPLVLTVPFLDWGVNGPVPPLRSQVDKRDGYSSGRSSSHVLRTILQHFYRLEDTVDREKSQVFGKHKPWKADRDLDLRIRRWYGVYPTSLNIDELWILVIDPEHIVTFSSNQSWKSRWPPLQLASRIAAVSFRATRNEHYSANDHQVYTALSHSVVCLSGAIGMLHRRFWADAVLPLSERFASHIGHLVSRSLSLHIQLCYANEPLDSLY